MSLFGIDCFLLICNPEPVISDFLPQCCRKHFSTFIQGFFQISSFTLKNFKHCVLLCNMMFKMNTNAVYNNAAWVTWLKIFGVKLHFIYFRSCERSELWDDTLSFLENAGQPEWQLYAQGQPLGLVVTGIFLVVWLVLLSRKVWSVLGKLLQKLVRTVTGIFIENSWFDHYENHFYFCVEAWKNQQIYFASKNVQIVIYRNKLKIFELDFFNCVEIQTIFMYSSTEFFQVSN